MATLSLQHSRLPLYPHANRNPSSRLRSFRLSFAIPRRRWKLIRLTASASSSPASSADNFQLDSLERSVSISHDSGLPSCSAELSLSAPTNKKGRGGALSILLQKSRVESQSRRKPPEVATGGGGGDIGKKNRHGGGDGGDDDDDDDYFEDDDSDEADERGLFRRRIVLQELFDKDFVDAVLQEWCKTMVNLPAGLRQAYEMGLVSSAQLVKYFTVNARPTATRFISRALPESVSRALVGRILADPAFLYKLLLESVATAATSCFLEFNNRKGRRKNEWDLALTNILTVTACNAFVFWSLAPCRSYGSTFRFDLQNSIQKLPNNAFEKSYPMREFDFQKRVQSFVYRTAQFGLVGALAGTVQGALSHFHANRKESRLSVTIPSVSSYAIRYGAFMGLYANMRYQALCGIDRAMFEQFDVLGVYLFFSAAFRSMNTYIGEKSRQVWFGLEPDLMQSATLLRSYNKPSEMDGSDSKWFISKNAIVSGLGLLGLNQGSDETDSEPSKPRKKRTVKKKVNARSF